MIPAFPPITVEEWQSLDRAFTGARKSAITGMNGRQIT
jgi:hypothetical protein